MRGMNKLRELAGERLISGVVFCTARQPASTLVGEDRANCIQWSLLQYRLAHNVES